MQPNPNLQHDTNVSVTPKHNTHHSHEFKHHIWSYIASIALTVFAFAAVAMGIIDNKLVLGMFLVLLAAIQVVFQLFIWMHMNQKGHGLPLFFMLSGIFVAIITVAALMLLIWW
jgi:cytochrome c oxidase subunit 4